MPTFLAALLMSQLALPASLEQDRLRVCMSQARTDPATAITAASEWLQEAQEVERSYPQQCLGFAFTSLLRWEAARDAFAAARDARGAGDFLGRARLGAMAGNAALAGEDFSGAELLFRLAESDALASGQREMAGRISSDCARALVGLGEEARAESALSRAREFAPQLPEIWLLSATLSRRQGDLETAQGHIATANLLDPANQAIGLEAGVIAALGGFEAAARDSWESVIAVDPSTPEAASARAYLAQFAEEEATP